MRREGGSWGRAAEPRTVAADPCQVRVQFLPPWLSASRTVSGAGFNCDEALSVYLLVAVLLRSFLGIHASGKVMETPPLLPLRGARSARSPGAGAQRGKGVPRGESERPPRRAQAEPCVQQKPSGMDRLTKGTSPCALDPEARD